MERHCRIERLLAFAALVALVVLASPALSQEDQIGARGFAPDKVFHVGDLDTVSLFNGNLTITLPLGLTYPVNGNLSYGYTAVYNSLIWEINERIDGGPGGEIFTSPVLSRLWNAGAGWMVSPGRLFPPNDPPENPLDPIAGARWMFVDSSGAKHWFQPQLRPGVGDGSSEFTRDSSYLRMRQATGGREIDFPNGNVVRFEDLDPGAGEEWRVTELRDVFGNAVDVAYQTAAENGMIPAGDVWEVYTDLHGRVQRLKFEPDPGEGLWRLYELELETTGGERADFPLAYATGPAELCYRENDPDVPDGTIVTLSYLTSIGLPDGTSYEMMEGTGPGYAADCASDGISGAIQTLRLPTLGELEWDYGTYYMPRDGSGPMGGPNHSGSSGVVERRALDASGTTLGTWRYGQEAVIDSDSNAGLLDAETRTYVVYPTGDCTKHFFRGHPNDRRDLGLPFSSMEGADGGGFFPSTEVWSSHTDDPGAGPFEPEVYCSGDQLRTTRVIYEDDGPGSGSDVNRRLEATRTVYDDDGGRVADSTLSDFDGLGHYRVETTAGTFGAGNVRTTTTDYELFVPAVSPGVIDIPASSSNWVIGTFGRRETSEGGETAVETFCFDTEGFMTRRRRFADTAGPIAEGGTDIVALFARNANNGNRIDERYYGGDTHSVGTGADLCALALPATETYRLDHRYRQGTLERSRYLDAGGGVVLTLFDHAVDASTGRVTSSADPAGLVTSFSYDDLGRLTLEAPAAGHGAQTAFSYTNASGTDPASVTIEKKSNDGTTTLATERVEFDALGRVAAEERELPDGVTSRRETSYDGRGWKTRVSEWEAGTPSNFTEFESYDAFGRPGTIRAPDGHEVTIGYFGVSQVSRTVSIATGVDAAGLPSEAPFTTVERFDRQGRLWQVDEPVGPVGSPVTTTYAYDEGNRLASASTTATVGGSPVTQNRTFVYDGRGFLTSETHPEKTSTVTYSGYDARGHAGAKTDGPVDVAFLYDRAERLTTVTDVAVAPAQVMKEFVYGTVNSPPSLTQGKLVSATRHNFLSKFGGTDLQISEVYEYAEPGGRVSKRTIERDGTPWFEQSFAWTELGNPASVTYATCTIATECPAAGNPSGQPARTVSYGYDAATGLLTSVAGYASSITYHSNQMLATVAHTNGVTDTWAPDPDAMRRPGRISTSGVTEGGDFDTGTYAYDGAGNIASTGADSFAYDGASRLVSGTAMGGQMPETSKYDPFGNRIEALTSQVGFRPIPTDPATNRLLSTPERTIAYDAAGRQTQWGSAVYTFDAFDQMILHQDPGGSPAVDLSYVYTADDERIITIDNVTPSETWVLRDLEGQVLRRFFRPVGSTTWQRDTIRREGTVLATEEPTGRRDAHLDHLGTIRLWSGPSGSSPVHHTYHAFGEEVVDNADGQALRFTGHERDTYRSGGCSGTNNQDGLTLADGETLVGCDGLIVTNTTVTSTEEVRFRAGERIELDEFSVADGAVWVAEIDGGIRSDLQDLDYMHARFCSPGVGRFLVTDPVASAVLASPQSWNKYSYALNNPLRWVDPDGTTVKSALSLISENAAGIEFASEITRGRVTPLEIARVLFQENRMDLILFVPELKNVGARALTLLGSTEGSFGIGEMKVGTAAQVLGWCKEGEACMLTAKQRDQIVRSLSNPIEAVILSALYLDILKERHPNASIEEILDRYNTKEFGIDDSVSTRYARSGAYLHEIEEALDKGPSEGGKLRVVRCGGAYRFENQCPE